ncbi:hypothetical protein KCP77_14685 [Salmonella enterica subsp. enterica]|nr:hypothetical protein KCP77_14685 [Salmonella enterica subsp. enterica]
MALLAAEGFESVLCRFHNTMRAGKYRSAVAPPACRKVRYTEEQLIASRNACRAMLSLHQHDL